MTIDIYETPFNDLIPIYIYIRKLVFFLSFLVLGNFKFFSFFVKYLINDCGE